MRHNNFQQTRKGLHFLGNTANGLPVFDRANSHYADHGFPEETMKKALSRINQTSKFEKHVVNMGEQVGFTNCVAVRDEDQVIMAVRKKHSGPTPMVLNREPEPCNSVVIILKKGYDYKGEYFILITAFIGEDSELEPWDRQLIPGSKEHQKSILFWQTHALLYDEAVIDYIYHCINESAQIRNKAYMPKILELKTIIQFFDLDKDNETKDRSDKAINQWVMWNQPKFTEGLLEWAEEKYPNTLPLYHCCFANLITYFVTGAYSGYETEDVPKERLTENKAYEFYTRLHKKLSPEDMTIAMIYFIISYLLQKSSVEDEIKKKVEGAIGLLEKSKNSLKPKQIAKARKILKEI